jgi:Ca2+-transporting ATPase
VSALARPLPRRPSSLVVPLSTSAPGRIRVRVQGLRDTPLIASRLEDRIAGTIGVHHVTANAVTGSVLILFDPRVAKSRRLMADVERYIGDLRSRSNGAGVPVRTTWHAEHAERVIDALRTSAKTGLTSEDARTRLAALGANRLPSPKPKSALEIISDHLTSLPVVLLGGAAALSVVGGALVDAAVILAVVAANAAVGYVTESRVERTLASLQDSGTSMGFVRRDGEDTAVAASALVPGDLLILRSGFDVPADARVVRSSGLAVNQAALTGESLPALKTAAPVPATATMPERMNMVYAGTRVVEGSGQAVITATGRSTEIGHVRALLAETTTPRTPLERQLDHAGRILVGVSLGLCGLTLGLGMLRGVPLLEMARSAISLAVAAVPEGLPAVATTTLALGMQRMMKRGMLVRRLSAVESLGATTLICADKTGTLTENRMTVDSWYLSGREHHHRIIASNGAHDVALQRALVIGALCNDAELENGTTEIRGSATEGALLSAALDVGIDYRKERKRHPLVGVRRRSDGENWMATAHEAGPARRLVAVKGAPEEVVRRADRWLDGDVERPMTPDSLQHILVANAHMAARGLRVLALAFREDDAASEPSYENLVWVGLVGLTDPVRPGVREAIDACRSAGIRTVILTGDQAATAAAVCRELDLLRDGEPRVLEAARLVGMDVEDLRRHAGAVDVFSRVSPAHKYHIVRAFQANGEVVAMTGDGINDAAALRAADIGVAMGAGGTDLAREVADVVLIDDDVGAIVNAVEQGRSIRENIGRALRFLLSTNFSEILVTLGALAIGVARPMSAIQFLWINLLSDVAPALALAVEPADPAVMRRPPDDPTKPLLSRAALVDIAKDGGLLAAVTLVTHGIALARYGAGPRATTIAFSTLTSAQLLHALHYRSGGAPGTTRMPSPLLSGVVAGSLALQAGTLLVPPLRRLLGLVAPSAGDWALIAGSAVAPLLYNEVRRSLTGPGPTAT